MRNHLTCGTTSASELAPKCIWNFAKCEYFNAVFEFPLNLNYCLQFLLFFEVPIRTSFTRRDTAKEQKQTSETYPSRKARLRTRHSVALTIESDTNHENIKELKNTTVSHFNNWVWMSDTATLSLNQNRETHSKCSPHKHLKTSPCSTHSSCEKYSLLELYCAECKIDNAIPIKEAHRPLPI